MKAAQAQAARPRILTMATSNASSLPPNLPRHRAGRKCRDPIISMRAGHSDTEQPEEFGTTIVAAFDFAQAEDRQVWQQYLGQTQDLLTLSEVEGRTISMPALRHPRLPHQGRVG